MSQLHIQHMPSGSFVATIPSTGSHCTNLGSHLGSGPSRRLSHAATGLASFQSMLIGFVGVAISFIVLKGVDKKKIIDSTGNQAGKGLLFLIGELTTAMGMPIYKGENTGSHCTNLGSHLGSGPSRRLSHAATGLASFQSMLIGFVGVAISFIVLKGVVCVSTIDSCL
ncbi:unnamed protein product [Ilex paraguariensis]|uniref:Uncharacterized protein n=1 Tax=Ilex paraguariensis TaxID=185542 RepID=A0ABC8SW37_9AQUA